MVFEEGRTLSFTDYICDDGIGNGPYELKLSLTRTGDKVHLDFTGSSPQAAGPINYYINENLTRMFFGIYMITVADPQILWNDGFYPLVDVTIPDGSYWKPKFPAALERPQPRHRPGLRPVRRPARADQPGAAQRRRVLLLAALHVLGLLLARASGRGSGSSCTRSGSAASPAGRSATAPTATRCGRASSNIPCEYLESYYPLRIEKWETVADTGGAGLHRGGNGVDVAYVFEEPGTIAIHDDRWLTYPWGVNGGQPGRPRHASGSSGPTAPARCCRASATTCRSRPGDVLHFVTWGGGGWGDPLERDPELVALEVRRGLVTAEGARRYGVCVADDGDGRGRRHRDAARPDARRPAGRPARLRHGAADRGAAGQLRGGDRAAGAEAPGLGRVSGAARGGVLRPGRLGRAPGAARRSTWCAPTPTRTARSACPTPAPAVAADAGAGRRPPARGGRPVVWTAVRYAPGLADGGLFVRKVPALACFAEGAPGGWGELALAPEPGEPVRGQAVRLGVLRHLAGRRRCTPPGSTPSSSRASRPRAACGPRAMDALQLRLPAAGGARRLRRPHAGAAREQPAPTSTRSTPTSSTCRTRSPTCDARPVRTSAGILLSGVAAGGGLRGAARAHGRPVLGEEGRRRLVDPQGRVRARRGPVRRRPARVRGGAGPPVPAGGRRRRSASCGRRAARCSPSGRPRATSTPPPCVSNTFELEWPPRSGRMQEFPEIDRAAWFSARRRGTEARRRASRRSSTACSRCAGVGDSPVTASSHEYGTPWFRRPDLSFSGQTHPGG